MQERRSSTDAARHVRQMCSRLSQGALLRSPIGERSDFARHIRDMLLLGAPIRLFFYWGCSPSASFGNEEKAYIEYLRDIASAIEGGAQAPTILHGLFTDTHAEINGVARDAYLGYYRDVAAALDDENWSFSYLSELSGSPKAMNDETPPRTGAFKRISDILLSDARRLYGEALAESRMEAYLSANLRESAEIKQKWPLGCFFHPGVPELKFMLPDLPMLYGYTNSQRSSRKPWFAVGQGSDRKEA